MAKKQYTWAEGAQLSEHSRRKLKILREYFYEYLIIRCRLPQQTVFRLAIVDGFAGGGIYDCGTPGSPIVFIQELRRASKEVNINRTKQGLGPIDIQCLLIMNDTDELAISLLKQNINPLVTEITSDDSRLHIQLEFLNNKFEAAYPQIKFILDNERYRNALFNLDQYGYNEISRETLLDIMSRSLSTEIFYTFSIKSLIAFLNKKNPVALAKQLAPFGIQKENLDELNSITTNNAWLGTAERMVFETFRTIAPFVSPFSINNPDGWMYWLIHFSNVYRARQAYNNTLHENSSMQAHFGRSGLDMLHYDPADKQGMLYLFEDEDRDIAKNALLEDIPRRIAESGDAAQMSEFYEAIYNATPAHADDIHQAIIDNPDLEVITTNGGARRTANTIRGSDVLKLKRQRSFFPILFRDD